MANNLLVDWLNNKKKNVQTNVLRKSATNTNNVTTPNLPIKPTTVSQTGLNLQKAQQPVQTRLNNINTQTLPTQTNTGVGSIAQTPNQSRFIGFQQQQPQAKSFNKLMNNEYLVIPTAESQANFANAKEENRYRTMSEAFYDLQGTLYKRGNTLKENELRQKFPEFKDLDIDVLNELQNELLPIVRDGKGVDADQISQIYPELLKGKELKDIQKIKESVDINNKKLQQIQTNIDKTLKTNWQSLSPNGMKYIQNWNTVLKTLDEAKKQGIVGGASNAEIIDYLAKNNSEFNNIFKELNGLELSEMDKAIVGKKDASLLKQVQNKMSQILIDQVTNSEKPTDEEIESVMRGKEKLENDFWGQTGKKIATEIGVSLDSLEKKIYRAYKDAQNWGTNVAASFIKDKIPKSYWEEQLGVSLTDEEYNAIVEKARADDVSERKQNVLDYQDIVNKEYESKKARNLDPDVENYVNNMGMTRSLLQGNLEAFGYKSAGDMAQNADMLVTTALGVVAPEVVLPLMAVDSYSRESQESFEELMEAQKKMGISQDEAYDNAQKGSVVVGLASATVELALEKLLGGVETTASKAWHDAFTKEFTKKATEMVAERGLADVLKQGATTQFKASLEEGLEEVLQQAIHNKAVQQYDPDQKLTEGLLQAFEGGFYNPMNLLAGGGDVFSNIDTNSIRQGVNNTVDNATARARNIINNVKDVTSRIEPAPGKIGEVFDSMRNKVTSQGGTNNTQQQGQQTQLNTASENQNNINGGNYNQNIKNSKALNSVQLGLLKSNNRMNPTKITEFQDKFGKDYGQALADMGYTESQETNVPKIEQDTKEIYNEKKKAMNSVEGEFKDRSLRDMLKIMLKKARNTLDYDMIDKYEKLSQKHNTKGLTMAEANDMREEFSYKVKTRWGGDGNSDKIDLANNVYTAVKNFLEKKAEANGIKDLQKMNREIAMRKYLSTRIGDKAERQSANNMVSLTDWVMLAEAASNPYAAAGLATKKIMQQPKVKNAVLNIVVGRRENRAIDQQNRQTANKERMENIESANRGKELQQELTPSNILALPNGIKLTKVTEIDNRKPKNKVTKKNNNKKSDSSSSDDTTSGGTPTGGTPAGTTTSNQGGTTDDTKTKKQPKKKSETKTKATSRKSAVTEYINETPQNERGQLEEIEAEENLRNNETPQRDMVEEAPKNKVTSKKAEATEQENKQTRKPREDQTRTELLYGDLEELGEKVEDADGNLTPIADVADKFTDYVHRVGMEKSKGEYDARNIAKAIKEYFDNHKIDDFYKKEILRDDGVYRVEISDDALTDILNRTIELETGTKGDKKVRQITGKVTQGIIEEERKNKVTAKKTEATAPKQEENQTKKFTYDEHGQVMNKIGEVEKKINDKLDKQYEQERAEKMSRFEELRDKEDKTDAEGKELAKLAGELNNMSNKYDRLKEEELKKQAPELLQQKEELQQAFDRDWKTAMDKAIERKNPDVLTKEEMKQLGEIQAKMAELMKDQPDAKLTESQKKQLENKTQEEKNALIKKWQQEWLEANPIPDEIAQQLSELYDMGTAIVERAKKARAEIENMNKPVEKSKTKATSNTKNKITNAAKAKTTSLFNENEVDKGNKSEGLNPDALPLQDYKEMQRLENGRYYSLGNALRHEKLGEYMGTKIATELVGDYNEIIEDERDPDNLEDRWVRIESDIEDMYDAYEDYLNKKNEGDRDEREVKLLLESADDLANKVIKGKTAKELIDQYKPDYEADLKIYKRLLEKYPNFYNGKINLNGENNTETENTEPFKRVLTQLPSAYMGKFEASNGDVLTLKGEKIKAYGNDVSKITAVDPKDEIDTVISLARLRDEHDFKRGQMSNDMDGNPEYIEQYLFEKPNGEPITEDSIVIYHLESSGKNVSAEDAGVKVKGKGYGTDLLNQLIKEAKRDGVKYIIAYDTTNRNSKSYWEKQGFEKAGSNHVLDLSNNKAGSNSDYLDNNETAQIPTIFEEDLEQMNLRGLQDNETPQDIDYQDLAELENETPQMLEEESTNKVTSNSRNKVTNGGTNLDKAIEIIKNADATKPQQGYIGEDTYARASSSDVVIKTKGDTDFNQISFYRKSVSLSEMAQNDTMFIVLNDVGEKGIENVNKVLEGFDLQYRVGSELDNRGDTVYYLENTNTGHKDYFSDEGRSEPALSKTLRDKTIVPRFTPEQQAEYDRQMEQRRKEQEAEREKERQEEEKRKEEEAKRLEEENTRKANLLTYVNDTYGDNPLQRGRVLKELSELNEESDHKIHYYGDEVPDNAEVWQVLDALADFNGTFSETRESGDNYTWTYNYGDNRSINRLTKAQKNYLEYRMNIKPVQNRLQNYLDNIENKSLRTRTENVLSKKERWKLDDGKIVTWTKAQYIEWLVNDLGYRPKEFPTGKTYANGEPKIDYMIVNEKNAGYISSKIENGYAKSLLEAPEEELSAEDEAKLEKELFNKKSDNSDYESRIIKDNSNYKFEDLKDADIETILSKDGFEKYTFEEDGQKGEGYAGYINGKAVDIIPNKEKNRITINVGDELFRSYDDGSINVQLNGSDEITQTSSVYDNEVFKGTLARALGTEYKALGEPKSYKYDKDNGVFAIYDKSDSDKILYEVSLGDKVMFDDGTIYDTAKHLGAGRTQGGEKHFDNKPVTEIFAGKTLIGISKGNKYASNKYTDTRVQGAVLKDMESIQELEWLLEDKNNILVGEIEGTPVKVSALDLNYNPIKMENVGKDDDYYNKVKTYKLQVGKKTDNTYFYDTFPELKSALKRIYVGEDVNKTTTEVTGEKNAVTAKLVENEKPKNLVTSKKEDNFMEEQAKSFDTPEAFIESAVSKDYKVGDNVKGLGTIQDVTDTQVKINGQRFAKKILGDNIDNVTLSIIRSTLDDLQAKNKDISDIISARKKGLYLLSFIQNSKNKQHLADIGYLEPVGDSSGAEGFTTAKSHMRDYANLKHGVENAEKQLREYWESVNNKANVSKPKNLVTSRIEDTKQEIQEIDKDTYFDDIVKNLKDHPREMFIYKDGSYFYPHYILPSGKVLTPENSYWGEVSSEEAARNWLLKEAEEHSEENETKKAEKLKEIVGKTAEKYEATLKRIESDNPMQEIWTSGDYFKYGMGNNQMARAKKESEANAEVGTFKKDVIDGKEGYRIFVAGTKNEAIRAFYEPKTGKTYRIYRGPVIDDSKPYTTKQVERIEKFLQNVDKQLDKETKKEKKEEKQVITQEWLDSLKPDKDGIIELDYKGDERWALGKGKEALIKEGKADGKYLYNYGGAAHPQYMALYIKNGEVYEGRKGLEDQYMTTKQEAVDWLNQKEKDVEHESTERYTQTDYETLPKTISVESEAEKAGPKRIAPDRVKRQQETYDQGLESVKNVLKQSPVKIYELGFKSDRSKAVQNILEERKRIRELPETEADKQWTELAKSVYEDLVIKDISKGYRYPEDVTSKFPKAQMKKAVDARARYEKGLFTSFSAKDTRANNQYRDEIGAGIKSQDGKPVTQEQMNEIVDGIRSFGSVFGLNMKKFAEDNNIIYVHLHGGNPFLMGGGGKSRGGGMNIAGLYRRGADGNISISLGGVELVMEKGEDGEMKKNNVNATPEHELAHAVDYMLENKLFSSQDIEILKKTMNKPTRLINYYNRSQEIVARAVEQYAANKTGKSRYGKPYISSQAYWDQENFDKYVKPIVEKNMKEKMKDYLIQQPKNNVIANDKNKITSK